VFACPDSDDAAGHHERHNELPSLAESEETFPLHFFSRLTARGSPQFEFCLFGRIDPFGASQEPITPNCNSPPCLSLIKGGSASCLVAGDGVNMCGGSLLYIIGVFIISNVCMIVWCRSIKSQRSFRKQCNFVGLTTLMPSFCLLFLVLPLSTGSLGY